MPIEEYRERITREKRAAALDAAINAFLEYGFDRTTLQQIANAAGISSATVFKHFPTKADLFGAIMERLWETGSQAHQMLPPLGNPRAGLLAIGNDYARLLRQPHIEPLFRVVIAEAPRFPELGKALYERGKAPYLEWLHRYLAAEVAAKGLSIADVPLAARQFLGMINDVIFWPRFLIQGLAIKNSEVERIVSEAVETMLARYGRVTAVTRSRK
ncbi:MAG: TetR/AcrR family transcriptional regulator [Prolixibacteraceae bacterium]|nr:TetR/AcrR family transcriptional regulator [Burkholderiales bacterium]